MLSALEEATGSFPEAVKICGKLLGSKGRVYPSTLNNVVLNARTLDGRTLHGQATACKSETALDTVWLESTGQPMPYVEAIRAIYDADFIVLGPGSLFTSIIPNLLVPGIPEAIERSKAKTIFVCSLADQQGETWGLSATASGAISTMCSFTARRRSRHGRRCRIASRLSLVRVRLRALTRRTGKESRFPRTFAQ